MRDRETLERVYDDLAYHTKEAAKLPLTFDTMSTDQQLFFRDLFGGIVQNKQKQEEIVEDLNLIKSDLEAVIANVQK